MKQEGKILIVSDMNVKKQEIYLLYKKREVMEKMFDTYKTVRTNSICRMMRVGHVFIAFLSLYMFHKMIRS